MKREGFLIIALIVVVFFIIFFIPKISHNVYISSFEECVKKGYPVQESYPRTCTINDRTFVEEIKDQIYCMDEQRTAEACIEIYQPVCGYVQVECITAPCDPVPQTFSNSCFACLNNRVIYYTEGECQ